MKVLVRQLRSRKSAIGEIPFAGATSNYNPVLLKYFSRGSIGLAPNDDGATPSGPGNVEPVVDFRAFTHPLDIELAVDFLKWIRLFFASHDMVEAFDPVMVVPNATTDEEMKQFFRSALNPTTGHFSGTAKVAPRELGGVVGPDLRVYGTARLSVADNSIIPLAPGTHTSSTAYAIGEKVEIALLFNSKILSG
jgi:choline dehydrogenase-like flavoprotein